jgi:hypothetical protein
MADLVTWTVEDAERIRRAVHLVEQTLVPATMPPVARVPMPREPMWFKASSETVITIAWPIPGGTRNVRVQEGTLYYWHAINAQWTALPGTHYHMDPNDP